jgi:undecaprenyl-diphosphatase
MNQFEASIILWIQENLRGFMDGFWVLVTHLGDDGILWITIGLALLIWKKTRPIGFTMLIALAIDFLIVNVTLKGLVARPRPFVVNEAIVTLIKKPSPYRSFPSGHTAGSFAAMLALYRWVPKKIGIPAVVLATLVALSRLYVGVHYPTDLVGGFVVGLICSTVAYYIVQVGKKKIGAKK